MNIEFETAKLAKQKGFNEPVFGYYDVLGNRMLVSGTERQKVNSWPIRVVAYAAPTPDELYTWLQSKGVYILRTRMTRITNTGLIKALNLLPDDQA